MPNLSLWLVVLIGILVSMVYEIIPKQLGSFFIPNIYPKQTDIYIYTLNGIVIFPVFLLYPVVYEYNPFIMVYDNLLM